MSHTDLCWLPATEMAAAIRARKLSPVELVDALIGRIHQLNPAVNAYCTLAEEAARQAARAAEAAVLRGDNMGLLHGVPVSIKDLLFTSAVRTMRGSRIYEQFVPDHDAPSVAKLKASGAILLGKTTTPEFGWKGATDSPLTGVSRNPWNRARSCGGSSGGAAAAVAAGMGPLAVGTDGAGSIRIPASFCGIVGLKPSRGRSVDLGYAPVEPEIAQICASAAQVFAGDLGCVVEEAAPGFLDPVQSLQILWATGLAAALGPYLAQWGDQMDPGLVELIHSAEPLSATDYAAAVMERDALWNRVHHFFARYDLLVTPTMPTTAFAAGVPIPAVVAGRSTIGFGYTPFTYPFNMTGQPAITVPCGVAADGLPVGLQIVGRRFADATVLRAAAAFEAARPWADRMPSFV